MPDTDRHREAERTARRWAAVSAERERLLAISRRRSLNSEDAEDCVQEALLRSVEFEGLDEERVGPFLTTVTMRLCADQHRARQRQDRLDRRLSAWRADEPGPEEVVCDRAEAAWLVRSLRGMPARQQQVIEARAQGLSDAEIARRLGVSYSSVASALARARAAARSALAAGAVWVVAVLRRPRAAAVATVAVGAVALVTTAPVVRAPAPPAYADAERPTAPAAAPAVAPAPRPAPSRAARPARPPAPRAAAATPAAAQRAPLPEPVHSERHETGRDLDEEIVHCLVHGPVVSLETIGCPR